MAISLLLLLRTFSPGALRERIWTASISQADSLPP